MPCSTIQSSQPASHLATNQPTSSCPERPASGSTQWFVPYMYHLIPPLSRSSVFMLCHHHSALTSCKPTNPESISPGPTNTMRPILPVRRTVSRQRSPAVTVRALLNTGNASKRPKINTRCCLPVSTCVWGQVNVAAACLNESHCAGPPEEVLVAAAVVVTVDVAVAVAMAVVISGFRDRESAGSLGKALVPVSLPQSPSPAGP